MSNKNKALLVPKLRFPQFKNADEWTLKKLDDCLDYLQPTQYLVNSTAYNDDNKIPVVTAGKTFILGYTNETDGVFNQPLPVIIFDDFTTASQFVNFPFKAKSSAMKILLAKKNANINFLYESMQQIDYEVGAHGRHWISAYSKIRVAVPEPREQQKIADCLSSLDELIAAQARKVDALKTHKKGLMRQFFPREGETRPRLRFPEFKNAPDWEHSSVGDVFDTTSGGTPSRSEADYWNGDIPWITTSLVNFEVITGAEQFISQDGLKNSSAKLLPQGTVLIAMYGQGKTRGQVALLGVKAATNQACAAVLPRVGINPYFVFLSFTGRYEEFRRLSNSGGQENLSQALIRDLPFAYPVNEKEQRRITDCLTSLDNLITAATEELETLKTHKQGLMQQLFSSVEVVEA